MKARGSGLIEQFIRIQNNIVEFTNVPLAALAGAGPLGQTGNAPSGFVPVLEGPGTSGTIAQPSL